MPNRGKFGSYENDYLKETDKVISEVKSQLPLDEYLRAQSVVNSSVNQINGVNGYSDNFNSGSDYGDNSQVNQKTLVRKMTPPGGGYTPGVNNSSYDQSSFSNQYVSNNMGYSNNDGVNPWLNKSGSTQTLILIFTAILVVLVVFVSLLVIKYMGM